MLGPVAWWEVLDDVDVEVPCGRARHRVRWSKGSVHLVDHDEAGERALVALGAEVPPCLDVLDLSRRPDRLGDLVPTSRIAAYGLLRRRLVVGGVPPSMAPLPGTLGRVVVSTYRRPTSVADARDLVVRRAREAAARTAVEAVPPMHDRLALAAVVAASRRRPASSRLAFVSADGAARQAVGRSLLAGLADGTEAVLDVVTLPGGVPAAFGWAEQGTATLRIALPTTWLALWAGGLGHLDGDLVLAATGRRRDGRLRLLTAAWRTHGRRLDVFERTAWATRTGPATWTRA